MKSNLTGLFCFLFSHFMFAQVPVGHNQYVLFPDNKPSALKNEQVTPAQHEISDSIIIHPAHCSQQDGSIQLTGPGEKRELQYSLDGIFFRPSLGLIWKVWKLGGQQKSRLKKDIYNFKLEIEALM